MEVITKTCFVWKMKQNLIIFSLFKISFNGKKLHVNLKNIFFYQGISDPKFIISNNWKFSTDQMRDTRKLFMVILQWPDDGLELPRGRAVLSRDRNHCSIVGHRRYSPRHGPKAWAWYYQLITSVRPLLVVWRLSILCMKGI